MVINLTNTGVGWFAISDTKLYVPVVTFNQIQKHMPKTNI